MAFVANTDKNRQRMLEKIGVSSFEELLKDIPTSLRLKKPPDIPSALSEPEVTQLMKSLSQKNVSVQEYASFLGGGSYDHFIPAAVGQLLLRSEFYTAYTPYQAEASQGTLQAIYEFQSLICRLTDMEVANASLYDGGSALAEAAFLAFNQTGRKRIVIPDNLHPFYRKVMKTYLGGQGYKITEVSHTEGQIKTADIIEKIDQSTAAVVIQNPNFFGIVEEEIEVIEKATHAKGALLILVCDPISLGILKTPGEYNADIAVGEGQSLGNRMSLGGPYLGFLACKKEFARRLPGRLIGATVDSQGRRGYVMTLQTREQHIRREKATSNICTNQGLMALAATIYLSLLGKEGIRQVARLCLQKAHYASKQIASQTEFKLKFNSPFFREFIVQGPVSPKKVTKSGLKQKIFAGVDLGQFKIGLNQSLLLAFTEKRTRGEIDNLVTLLKSFAVQKKIPIPRAEREVRV